VFEVSFRMFRGREKDQEAVRQLFASGWTRYKGQTGRRVGRVPPVLYRLWFRHGDIKFRSISRHHQLAMDNSRTPKNKWGGTINAGSIYIDGA